jgi:hypothetical protein
MSEQAPEHGTEQPQAGGQEPATFDAEYVKKLRAQAAQYRTEAKANADAASRLAALEESQKTETQRLLEERDALRAERDQVRSEALRTRVALNKGLPGDLADRLRGATEDEMSEDADRLLELLKPSGTPRFGGLNQGVSTPPPTGNGEAELARALFRGPT